LKCLQAENVIGMRKRRESHSANLTGPDTGQKHEYNHDTLMRMSGHGRDQATCERPCGKPRIYNSLQTMMNLFQSR